MKLLFSSSLRKAMAPHSSTLAWRIPWTEEPGGLQSMAREESDTTERLYFHFHALEKETATHSSVLAWRIPGTGEPGGLLSVGSHRVRHDWSDLAAVAARTTQQTFELAIWTTDIKTSTMCKLKHSLQKGVH